MLRLLRRAALAALALSTASLLIGAPALASAGDSGDVTWMVRPSDGQGEDGRSWVERELDAGETVTEHLVVRNLSSEEVTFSLSAADGYFTDTGRFNMLTADRASVDAGTWIALPDAVTVPSGADVVVPFEIAVPADATPGDHVAGVAAGIRSGGDDRVGIESRVGFRVMTRVAGELAPAVATSITTGYAGTWNPFEAGRLDGTYVVRNTGNTRLAVTPRITVAGPFGLFPTTLEAQPIEEMAPGESRTGALDLPSAWPLFAYTTTIEAQATSVSPGAAATAPRSDASSVAAAVPWSQAVAVILVALAVWMLWRDRRRRERVIDERIERARQEGRESAATRTSAAAASALAVLLLAGAVVVCDPVLASAATVGEPGSVVISVDIADDSPTIPSPAPTGGSATDPALAATGAGVPIALAAAGAGALGLGIAACLARLRRRGRLDF
ncbi:hypothetical protein ACIQLJ_03460 [Microbacterium sp. NPDC091313]